MSLRVFLKLIHECKHHAHFLFSFKTGRGPEPAAEWLRDGEGALLPILNKDKGMRAEYRGMDLSLARALDIFFFLERGFFIHSSYCFNLPNPNHELLQWVPRGDSMGVAAFAKVAFETSQRQPREKSRIIMFMLKAI